MSERQPFDPCQYRQCPVDKDDIDSLKDLILELKSDYRTGFSGIHQRFDDLNGRVRTTETKVAVLEDRSPGRVSAAVSAVVSGVVSAAGWLLK